MGNETSKCLKKRMARGDFQHFLKGHGLDIGAGADPLESESAKVDVWDLPQGDAQYLSGLLDNHYDFVYSSHCLEHMQSVEVALANWCRVVKPGGYLYIVVPDFSLYEKDQFPSNFNSDHKHTFSVSIPRSVTHRNTHWNIRDDIAILLAKFNVEIRKCFLEDDNYDYNLPLSVDQTHNPNTLAQVCIIAQKGRELDPQHGKNALSNSSISSLEPLRIYTGILGQIGDIVMFTPTARKLKQLFPNCRLTFAVSRKYSEAGALVAGLPFVDRIFIVERYFENLAGPLQQVWQNGWPVDIRGDDEVEEQRRHDLIFETRPRYRRMPWWQFGHQVEESAHRIGVPGPIDLQTEIRIPVGTMAPEETIGKVVVHNDPSIDPTKAWNWDSLRWVVKQLGASNVVILGNPGPEISGVLDYRGKTNLATAAAIIEKSRCYLGIDSGLMWIAASLKVNAVGMYGTSYIPAYGAIHPKNERATYLQVEGGLDRVSKELVLDTVQSKLRL